MPRAAASIAGGWVVVVVMVIFILSIVVAVVIQSPNLLLHIQIALLLLLLPLCFLNFLLSVISVQSIYTPSPFLFLHLYIHQSIPISTLSTLYCVWW